jgi:HlyD family secretion protein
VNNQTRLLSRMGPWRWLLPLPLALGILSLSVSFLRPVEAKAFTVNRGAVLREVRGSGTLESVQEVPLAFKVGGRIRELPVDEGSTIRQGQLLGRLDPTDLEAQFSVARSRRGQAEAAIGRAGAELDQARATADRARGDFQRVQQLHRDGILSRADLDAAQEKVKVA